MKCGSLELGIKKCEILNWSSCWIKKKKILNWIFIHSSTFFLESLKCIGKPSGICTSPWKYSAKFVGKNKYIFFIRLSNIGGRYIKKLTFYKRMYRSSFCGDDDFYAQLFFTKFSKSFFKDKMISMLTFINILMHKWRISDE